MANARSLHFNLASSDSGPFGMNTPAYFAIDDLTLDVNVLPGDYNADGAVDAADYTVWQNAFGSTTDALADGNGDGVVNLADYTVWRDYQAAGVTPWSSGDANGDGAVDLLDLDILGGEFGMSGASSVPEPMGIALVTIAGLLAATRRQRV